MLSPLETALTGQPFRRLYCRMLDELAQEWSLSRTEAEVMFLLSCDKTWTPPGTSARLSC